MSTRQRDWIPSYNCFFITTTFKDWLTLFIDESYYEIVSDSIRFCLKKYNAELLGYVFMPTHIHLILFYNEKSDVSGFMRDMKKYTSAKIRDKLIVEGRIEAEKIKYNKNGQYYKVWKDRFDCVIIKNGKIIMTKLTYIHENPVRKGLVEYEEEWKYSSAGFYKTENEGVLPITHAWKVS